MGFTATGRKHLKGGRTARISLLSALFLLGSVWAVGLLPGAVAQDAIFAPPHADVGEDTDMDTLLDRILLTVGLDVTEAGTFFVQGGLHDPTFTLFTFGSRTVTLGVGAGQEVTLSFDGRPINAAGIDGPYTVDLDVSDFNTFALLDSDTHTTAAYSASDFDPPGASLAPPHSDMGVDTDVPPNGLFDEIHVDVSLDVIETGRYQVVGFLHDPSFSFFLIDDVTMELDVGLGQTVPLVFDARSINAAGVDGPYFLDLDTFDDTTFTLIDSDTHTTAAYSASDFDPIPATFAASHADLGVDTDDPTNALFDILQVDVGVDVIEAGTYQVQGCLYDPGFAVFTCASATSTLSVGAGQTVSLAFDGRPINAAGVDGPYTVDLDIYEVATFTLIDSDGHTTAAYLASAFDPWPITFAPGHADVGLDTDDPTNGLFNEIHVDVSLDVVEAGTYRVLGTLFDPTFTLVLSTSVQVAFEVGPQTVPLCFYGPAIRASGINGPYTVSLDVVDPVAFDFFDVDTYVTDTYLPSEFDASESLSSSPTAVVPGIDGVFSLDEWDDATMVDLSAIPGNGFPGSLFVKNDDAFLSFAYDAVGDTTEDDFDAATIAFDTGNDGIASAGREDLFFQGGTTDSQFHFVFDSIGLWTVEDSPYDTTLPNHQGLASASGFGPSENSGTAHRIYEFAIPLPLLGATSGDTIGFLGGGVFFAGVRDFSTGLSSSWPSSNSGLPLGAYADLGLVDATSPVLSISSPSADGFLLFDSFDVRWTASDAGSGLDHFEVSLDGGPPVNLPASATSHEFTGVADGAHTVDVFAVDVAGNVQVATVDFTVDATSPTLSIASPGLDAFVATNAVEVTWTSTDATSGLDHFELILDGGAKVNVSGTETSHIFTGVADGAHTLLVFAVDVAGNAALEIVDFTVDATSPTLSIDSPASDETVSSSSVEVTWTGADQTSGIDRYEVSLDGGPPVNVPASASAHTFEGVADGAHTISVTAFDLAGNMAATSVDITVAANVPAFPELVPGFGGLLSVLLIAALVGVSALVIALFLRRGAGAAPPGAGGPPGPGGTAPRKMPTTAPPGDDGDDPRDIPPPVGYGEEIFDPNVPPVYILSDFHLGSNRKYLELDKSKSNDMDKETLDTFLRWLNSVDRDAAAYDHYDVVMNGDYLDLWQAKVPGKDSDARRLNDILESNADFLSQLGKHIRSKYPRLRFYYVIGNHDDGLYDSSDGSHTKLRNALKAKMGDRAKMPFKMDKRYTNPQYQLLVEHGHQHDSMNWKGDDDAAPGKAISEQVNHMQESHEAFKNIEFTANQQFVYYLLCLKANEDTPEDVLDLIDGMESAAMVESIKDSPFGSLAKLPRYLSTGILGEAGQSILSDPGVDPAKLKKDYEKKARKIIKKSGNKIVVFAHTHLPDLQPRTGQSDWGYANTGSWLRHIKASQGPKPEEKCNLTTTPSDLPYVKISKEDSKKKGSNEEYKALVELKYYSGKFADSLVKVTLTGRQG